MTFAGVDWGTSSFRLWLMDSSGAVLAERRSEQGMEYSAAAGFGAVLESHLEAAGAKPETPVVVCGMAGARNGWVEAKYLDVPVDLNGLPQAAVPVTKSTRKVFILPGIAQRQEHQPDVMRGEETQILGAASLGQSRSTMHYCIPGTHSKWVSVSEGRVQEFNSYMTGELFAAISQHTILHHSIEQTQCNAQHNESAFADAVNEAYTRPQKISQSLFSIRAAGLLFEEQTTTARDRLSGLLIGLELSAALDHGEANNAAPITLLASGALAQRYNAAFQAISIKVDNLDAERCVRAGLYVAAQALFNSSRTTLA